MQTRRNQGESIGELNDDSALFAHYVKAHNVGLNTLALSDAYRVTFLDNPMVAFLDVAETFWINKLKAKINIMKTFDSIVKF